MKIRKGLVSNSSSASFILVCDDFDKMNLLNIFLNKAKKGNINWGGLPLWIQTIKDLEDFLETELKEIDDLIKIAKRRAEDITAFEDEDVKRLIALWTETILHTNPETATLRDLKGFNYEPSDVVRFETAWINREIKRQEQRKEDIETILSKIGPKLDKETEVLLLEVDNWDAGDFKKILYHLDVDVLLQV